MKKNLDDLVESKYSSEALEIGENIEKYILSKITLDK